MLLQQSIAPLNDAIENILSTDLHVWSEILVAIEKDRTIIRKNNALRLALWDSLSDQDRFGILLHSPARLRDELPYSPDQLMSLLRLAIPLTLIMDIITARNTKKVTIMKTFKSDQDSMKGTVEELVQCFFNGKSQDLDYKVFAVTQASGVLDIHLTASKDGEPCPIRAVGIPIDKGLPIVSILTHDTIITYGMAWCIDDFKHSSKGRPAGMNEKETVRWQARVNAGAEIYALFQI